VQQHIPFKPLFALREEIKELGLRFKRLVDKISYVEELASNIELELTKHEAMLQHIVSAYRPLFTREKNSANIQQVLFDRDASDGLHASLTPQPAALYEELVEFFNLFLATEKRYRELAGRISSLEGSASNLGLALSGMQERIKAFIQSELEDSNEGGMISVIRRPNRIPAHLLNVLARAAESGVVSINAKRYANGKGEFEIDGRKLTLSPRLADMLIALSKDFGPRSDDLVGWKTLEELAQLVLPPKHGSPPKDSTDQKKIQHRMRQSIHLLGKAFHSAGINPFLIQSNPGLGYRFALRCSQAGPDADNSL
jgi:hypothetical protein